MTTTVWFNPSCSKCRTAQALLAERGVEATYVEYLQSAPTTAELRRVLAMLGADDPRTIARVNDPLWAELGLDAVPGDRILEALHEHPILIERPIVIIGDRAVVARPPERALELLDEQATPT